MCVPTNVRFLKIAKPSTEGGGNSLKFRRAGCLVGSISSHFGGSGCVGNWALDNCRVLTRYKRPKKDQDQGSQPRNLEL